VVVSGRSFGAAIRRGAAIGLGLALGLPVTAGANATSATAEVSPAPSEKLTIERLYSLPWVIGTRPESPQWSPDSRHVAFLWNDEGTNFYDVWLTDVATAKPVRITSMPRPPSPADPGKDMAKLEQVARAETDRGVSEVLWAPDGKQLIFNFHGQLYAVLPGQTPQRLIDSPATQGEAASSPRKNEIAYISGGDLWVVNVGSGPGPRGAEAPARKIYSSGRKDVSVEAFNWSPDGKRISIVESDASRVPMRGIPDYLLPETQLNPVRRPFPGEPSESRRIGVISIDGGNYAHGGTDARTVQWLDLGGDPLDQIFTVAWSPDGKTLLVDKSDLYIKDRRLLLADPLTGHSRPLLREADPHNVTAEWWSDWAPDGRGIYFISDRDNDYHVYYQALSGGTPKPVTQGDWAVFSAALVPAANALFVVTNQGKAEERQTFRVPLRGGAAQRVTLIAGTHLPVPSPDGKYIADVFSNDVTPPDLYLQAATGLRSAAGPAQVAAPAAARRVTLSPLPEFQRLRWVAAKYVTFKNVDDGTILHARLTLPPDFDPGKQYPAILGSVYSNTVHNEWGGRIFHPTWGIDQFLAQQGYVIMNVDISGSSGYGKSFRQRIREDYGGVDVDDLYSGVKYLVGQGFVDEHRVGIWGSSYGGLLTVTSLFKKPGVYKVGVAGAPATSLFHAQTGEMRTMMAPQDHQEQYQKSSAFLQSGGLKDHLLIIHGMRDDTVLFQDSIVLEHRLILQESDIDFVPLPDAPHGWDTEGLAQTRYANRKLFEYFERYLGETR
jgi:dipeptidyl-peptidase-4